MHSGAAILLLGIYPTETQAYAQEPYTRMFTEHYSLTAKNLETTHVPNSKTEN